MHIVTLSFDDGFKKTNLEVARIYEKHGLSACFNIVAAANTAQFVRPPTVNTELGDWPLWNELQERGHEIMPHGLRHENKTTMSFESAKALTLQCLEIFEEKLDGFECSRAVYNFPFNASTPEMEAWLPMVVRAYRVGWDGLNPLPAAKTVRITCAAYGPENCEADLDRWIDRLLKLPEGWLVYNTHGLDDEGWGPISSAYLERLIDRLAGIDGMRLMPVGAVLRAAGEGVLD